MLLAQQGNIRQVTTEHQVGAKYHDRHCHFTEDRLLYCQGLYAL